MAQDPGQQQPGAEARANDQSMVPAPTEQDIQIATQHYLQMKQGMDKRVNAYAASRQDLMAMTLRNLEQWVKVNCESIEKLVKKKSTKPLKVDLILAAIKKQRVWDLKLLKTCRDDAIRIGVPANKLPWTYGELDDGERNQDQGKVPDEEKKNDNKNGNNDKNGDDRSYDDRITWLYSELDKMKEERKRDLEKNGNGSQSGNSSNGNGSNSNSNSDTKKLDNGNNNSNGNQVKQDQLKRTIMDRMKGQAKRIPAKDVS